jgi:hypothetical protein
MSLYGFSPTIAIHDSLQVGRVRVFRCDYGHYGVGPKRRRVSGRKLDKFWGFQLLHDQGMLILDVPHLTNKLELRVYFGPQAICSGIQKSHYLTKTFYFDIRLIVVIICMQGFFSVLKMQWTNRPKFCQFNSSWPTSRRPAKCPDGYNKFTHNFRWFLISIYMQYLQSICM